MPVARVRRTLLERGLIADGQRILVACSGGPDSVGLAAILHRLAPQVGFSMAMASIDHGLRPDAAQDVEFARKLADALDVPFHAISLRLDAGPSLQARAREARYAALRALAASNRFDRIAVGHTMDDQAETVLARILRGSGVAGLAAIDPARPDGVVRPLIDCRRAEVLAYVQAEGLAFATDPSNADLRFERVRLREQIVPALLAEDPALVEHLASLADDARRVAGLVGAEAHALVDPGAPLEVAALSAAPAVIRSAALADWARGLTGRPPGRAQVRALEQLLGGRGEVRLAGGWVVSCASGRLEAVRAPRKKRLPARPKASEH